MPVIPRKAQCSSPGLALWSHASVTQPPALGSGAPLRGVSAPELPALQPESRPAPGPRIRPEQGLHESRRAGEGSPPAGRPLTRLTKDCTDHLELILSYLPLNRVPPSHRTASPSKSRACKPRPSDTERGIRDQGIRAGQFTHQCHRITGAESGGALRSRAQ